MRPAGTRVWKGWTSNAVKPAPNCPQLLDFLPGFSPSPSGAVPHVGCSMPCSGSGARVLLGCQAGQFRARLHCPQVCALRQQIQGLQLADHGRVELPRDTLTPGRFSSGLPVDLSVSHGELQVNPNEAAAAPSPRGCGGQLHSGVFQGTLSPATPLGEVISNDGKPTALLLGFPADREILFTFFLKEFFFS